MPKEFFKRYTPSPKQIKDNRFLSILGDYIHRPNLWHMNRHSVAKAFAIGLFCTWLPFPFQTVVAAFLAIIFCANLPLSVALVFITNPITIPPLFYFSYWFGTVLLDTPAMDFEFQVGWEWLSSMLGQIWQPLVVGSLAMGVICSILGYCTVKLIWRHYIVSKWKHRAIRVATKK